jgi:branched-chain amino acid transport system permease protein
MVGVSLVVLTGWAGQISLGHMGIVGAAAAAAAGLAANHNLDAFVVLAAGVVTGTVVSVLVGIPALRVQGLYLAVTTLAFAGAAEFYLLKSGYPIADRVLPSGDNPRVHRPVIWQRLDLADERTFFFVSVAILLAMCWLAVRFRRSRSGRVFLAVRDNSRAAPAYAVDVVRSRLAAFALSGAIASIAGVLFAYQQQAFDATTYGIGPSIEIFVATAIGGLASVTGAVLGVVVVFGIKLFGESILHNASLLVTGPGLLVVLYLVPGGLGQLFYSVRDAALRTLATSRGIDVPSLIADRRIGLGAQAEPDLVDAEEHAEHVERVAVG